MAVVVDIPTGLAYAWIYLGFVTAGLLLYVFFIAAAFKIKLFWRWQQWPIISKLALFCGPVLLLLGLYFSTIETGYYMVWPLILYFVISAFGCRAIAVKFEKIHD